jgi:YD repeat-containing protein
LGNATTYTYDSFNLYVATSTNALSQATGYQYDYSLGKPKSVIDPNNRVFQTVYDGLDRVVTEKQPDLTTPSTLVTKKTYAYTDTQGSRKVIETNYLDGSTDFTLYTYLDGMDRTLQTRREAEASNQFAVRDFVYNNVGLVQKGSLPYFSNGSARISATATSSLYTTYAYDVFGRATTTATAVGTTTSAYDDWTITITDPNNNIKKLTNDAYNRLATVVEKDGATYATTTYAWHADDTLATTTDADGNVRRFTYDGRGLRLTAEDLHDTGDGTFGTWTYAYDDAGNLSSFVDPMSQTINFTYDNLNRVLTEDYTGQAGTEIAYGYDTCTDGKTRICVATSTGAVSTTTYTALGSIATTTTAIDNTFYTTAYRYDRQGNLTNVVYPDTSQVQYTYNTAGLPETVQQKESGGSFGNVVSDFDYGPHGQVTYKLFGNDVESTYTFDATKLYRLQNILTVASSSGEGFGEGGGELGFGYDPWSPLAMNPDRHPLAIAKLDLSGKPRRVEEFLEDVSIAHRPDHESPKEDAAAPAPQETPAGPETAAPSSDAPEATPDGDAEASHGEDSPQEEPENGKELPAPDLAEEQTVLATGTTTASEPLGSSCLNNQSFSILQRIETCPVAENELATFKANEIAKLDPAGQYTVDGFEIEIQSMHAFDEGVEVFVKAWWPEGEQVGFGDGTVEIERIRRFMSGTGKYSNLTYLVVPDTTGPITTTDKVQDLKLNTMVDETVRFREDPVENLRRDIGHTVSVIAKHRSEKIVKGKSG